ncbi:pyridoxamine 5'-phosphate oxidase [Alphaproteobacteria bacterium 46_93_T64]|nr:pyridoxamine 5'-phosphate oxidase [Alphaproteobacteria bacterium 46_93_T64]
MGKTNKLSETNQKFIEAQQMFFVATAGRGGHVNVSPKGMDTLRIMSDNRIIWLNLTGSGNETAAHLVDVNRMTLMFCAFEGEALILRVYGQAKIIHPRDPDWTSILSEFPEIAGSRQIFDLTIDLVQSSCGTGVPVMDFVQSRGEEELVPYFENMGQEGVKKFWRRKNVLSIDDKPTRIFDDN